MMLTHEQCIAWLRALAALINDNTDFLTDLGAAIGGTDHGTSMAHGVTATLGKLDPAAPLGSMLKSVSMALVSTVGESAGPLYGTFFMKFGAKLGDMGDVSLTTFAAALEAGRDGVVARGKATVGEKTMIDAMTPAVEAFDSHVGDGPLAAAEAALAAAQQGRDATIPLVAKKGRVSYLGERSAGHQDPGATSTAYLFEAPVTTAREDWPVALVGLIVVSHSRALAEAAVELSLQMVHGTRPEIVVATGTPEGGFGTDTTQAADAVRAAGRGVEVVVLMDLGSAVLSAEFAMELVEDANAILVAAPFVKGLLAATVCVATGGTREEVADEARAALGPKLAALGLSFPADEEPPEKPGEVPWAADMETRITLPNASGLHAHPTALLVAEAGHFDAEVRLRCHGVESEASSPIALAILNARKGDEVWIEAYGPQVADAVAVLESLISNGFGESMGAPEATVAAPAGPQGVSPGRVVGIVRLMAAPLVDPPAEARLLESQLPGEKTRLKTALEEVAVGYEARAASSTDEVAQIMLATATLARDPKLLRSAQALIDALGVGAAAAM